MITRHIGLNPVWIPNKKIDAVIRIIQGEDIKEVSQETGIDLLDLSSSVDMFLTGGINAFKIKHRLRPDKSLNSSLEMISLSQHAFRLARVCQTLFIALVQGYSSDPVSDYLFIASSIHTFEIDFSFWDSCIYCGNDYQNARSDLFEIYLPEVLAFLYGWGAMESVLNLLGIYEFKVPISLKSKCTMLDNAQFFLKMKLKDFQLPLYLETIEDLRRELIRSYGPSENSADRDYDPTRFGKRAENIINFDLEPHMSENGLGLKIVRKIRNKLFHGDLIMPEPGEKCAICYIELANRLILMSMQLILLAYFNQSDLKLSNWEYAGSRGGTELLPLSRVLEQLHLSDTRP